MQNFRAGGKGDPSAPTSTTATQWVERATASSVGRTGFTAQQRPTPPSSATRVNLRYTGWPVSVNRRRRGSPKLCVEGGMMGPSTKRNDNENFQKTLRKL